MHVSRLRDERGTIMVLAAVMIPVFLLLAALVIDVGNWYTHKRQLQNRADAAAFAAGVEYAKNWSNCVYAGADPAKLAAKAAAAQKIADAARQYAGDPEASDYAGGVLPATPLRNTEIATQGNVDVMINSDTTRNYMNNSDYTDADGGVGAVVANPCYVHPADDISKAGHWTDVKVKERDLPSLFGGIGLPLPRNIARARIDVRPAVSGKKFMPLAIPNNVITKVQVRYYDECRNQLIPNSTQNLAPLPDTQQAAFASLGGGILWGMPKVAGDLSVGDGNVGFGMHIPDYDPVDCGGQGYLPVGIEVRIASRDEVDFNQTCAQLLASKFADCFRDISLIRVWDDGNPNAHPLIKEVTLSGGCANRADAYFSPYTGLEPVGGRTCNYGASVNVDFGNRYPGSSNFMVQVNGVDLLPPNGAAGNPTGTWVTNGTPLVATTAQQGGQPETGDNPVRVKVFWKPPSGSQQSYPSGNGAGEVVQQVYIGTQDSAGAIDLARTSGSGFASGLPSAPLDNITDGNKDVTVFPTIGIRSVLRPGIFTTLRTESSQGSQLVACDPAVPSGQEFTLFNGGCQPWFGPNPFTNGDWWNTATKECPNWNLWYGTGTMPAPYGLNSSTNPWRCVLQAPGSSVGQTGDWMIVATQNCKVIGNNKCQNWKTAAEAYCGNYDGTPADPTGANSWLKKGGDLSDPRVISLFIIPYQALKSVSGSKAEIPILGFASFYVMGWRGQKASEDDPCPDPDFKGVAYSSPDKGTVQGVFVAGVQYEPGPVDENAVCTEDLLTFCRPTLVR
jgi:Flp pilus assembly protein TadG